MRRTLASLIVFSAVACSTDSTPTSPAELPGVRMGKSPAPAISRALLVFSDNVNVAAPGQPEDLRPAGITGDGRLRDGNASTGVPSNEYQGGLCGVSANIENGPRQTGDLDYTPDLDYTSTTACGARRYYNFFLGGTGAAPTQASPHSRVSAIWALTVGQTALKGQGFGVRLANCNLLMFNSQYGGDDLTVTRLDDGTGPRRWTVASQGAHMAACVIPKKGAGLPYAPTGTRYYLPFHLSVTEVP